MHTHGYCSIALPPWLQAHPFIIHRNQISEVVEESCFSLSLSLLLSFSPLSHSPSFLPCTSSPLVTSPLPGKNCFYCDKHSVEPSAYSSPSQSLMQAVGKASKPSSQAALPVWKMSNSLIVIMRLCHLPIIGMIKDEIFREAGLLTWSGRDIGPVENEFYQL